MAEIFGWSLVRKKEAPLETFAPEERDDGAVVVNAGGVYGTYVDIEGTVRTDSELIVKYREIALQPEVQLAIDDIVNEAIVNEPEDPQVKIVLDGLDVNDRIKKLIEDEFDNVLMLMEFNRNSYETFRQWYIDGRTYWHMIIDLDNPREGIKELRWIDARKIRKVREITKKRSVKNPSVSVQQTVSEYYVYSDKGFTPARPGTMQIQSVTDAEGVKIAKDAIAYVTSGLTNPEKTVVLSFLHQAMKPLNMLKSMEDSLVIYRVSRAPERRIFYIDVGNLPKMKAEQHVKDLMTKFKNKVVYDATTGSLRDDRKFMTMLEDFWLPRRGDRGTEITTLPGGQNLGQIDDILYFQKNLYKALNVPISRMDAESTFDIGRATSISRDEIKFQKFINRLRLKFQNLFLIILGKQLILKGIVTEDDWNDFQQKINFRYATDNMWAELKDVEIMRERMELVTEMDPFVGKYYSGDFVRKNILRFNESECEDEDQKIKEEQKSEQWKSLDQQQLEFEKDQADKDVEQSKPFDN